MIILRKLLDRKADMKALSDVLADSLAIAQRDHAENAGAEHLLLAALAMDDGSARQAFAMAGADPDALAGAIASQHAAALPHIDLPDSAHPPTNAAANGNGAASLKVDATYDAAVKATHGFHKDNGGRFVGAYLVAGVASIEHGTAARALEAMNLDPDTLVTAARETAKA